MTQSPDRPAAGQAARPAAGRSTGLAIDAAWEKDPGRVRVHNEDAVAGTHPGAMGTEVRGCLYLVADGMGGANAGEVASAEALRLAGVHYYADTEPDLHRSLDRAVREANYEIYRRIQADPALRDMGTTLTAAVVLGRRLYVAQVGDSRLYLVRGGEAIQITHDHSWAEEQIRSGARTRQQAERHPQRRVLTRALGLASDVKVDHFERQLQPGDAVILCTDGVTTHVPDAEMAACVASTATAHGLVKRLIAEANAQGGSDNIAVAAIRVRPAGAPPPVEEPAGQSGRRRGGLALPVLGILLVAGVLGALVWSALQMPLELPLSLGPLGPTAVAAIGEPEKISLAAQPSSENGEPAPATSTPDAEVATTAAMTEAASTVSAASTASPWPDDSAAADTATPAAAETPSPTPAFTETPVPSPTPAATDTPEPTATAPRPSPTPAPSAVTEPAEAPEPTAAPAARLPAPALGQPNGETVNTPLVTFAWSWPGSLGPGQGYALFLWPAGTNVDRHGWDLPAIHDACGELVTEASLEVALGNYGPGNYEWTVMVVDQNRGAGGQCAIVSEEPAPHRLTYALPAE